VIAVSELERLSKRVPDWSWSKTAVIAREWKYLEPVRSYCESLGIPVQTASGDPPNFWRLREAQSLVTWLRGRERSAIQASQLATWMDAQPEGPWWEVLRDCVTDFQRDVGDRDADREDILEFLAEWGRGFRIRQTGLLLLSAHRAKGLEFEDVVVLDGGWGKISREEDVDAARRLYYVAMTRARRSLALISMGGQNPLLQELNDEAFLSRNMQTGEVDVSECGKIYRTLDLSQVDLGFAGRLADGNPSLAAISRLQAGDQIKLAKKADRWLIMDGNGISVAQLARKFSPPQGTRFLGGQVNAVTTRFKSEADEEYHSHFKRERWETILPELVFEHQSTP
jgi:ATP-dependent DNA helicase RecQ